MKKKIIEMWLFAVLPLLLFHGRAEAFFGMHISKPAIFAFAAIALLVVLLVVAGFVFGIRKLIRICQARNSLRPAWLAMTLIIVAGVTAAYFHNTAEKRAREYRRNYYEQARIVIPENTPTDRVSTRAWPKPPPEPLKILSEGSSEPVTIKGPQRMDEKKDE